MIPLSHDPKKEIAYLSSEDAIRVGETPVDTAIRVMQKIIEPPVPEAGREVLATRCPESRINMQCSLEHGHAGFCHFVSEVGGNRKQFARKIEELLRRYMQGMSQSEQEHEFSEIVAYVNDRSANDFPAPPAAPVAEQKLPPLDEDIIIFLASPSDDSGLQNMRRAYEQRERELLAALAERDALLQHTFTPAREVQQRAEAAEVEISGLKKAIALLSEQLSEKVIEISHFESAPFFTRNLFVDDGEMQGKDFSSVSDEDFTRLFEYSETCVCQGCAETRYILQLRAEIARLEGK